MYSVIETIFKEKIMAIIGGSHINHLIAVKRSWAERGVIKLFADEAVDARNFSTPRVNTYPQKTLKKS